MATIEDMIRNSVCFGVAYDPRVRECKICEVALKCEGKCRRGHHGDKLDDITTEDKTTSDTKPASHTDRLKTESKPPQVVTATKDEVSTSMEAVAKSEAAEKKAVDDDKPATAVKNTEKNTEKKPKKEKPKKNYSPEMPVFKDMTMDEMLNLLRQRGGDADKILTYKTEAIQKMRVIMALKKTYEV